MHMDASACKPTQSRHPAPSTAQEDLTAHGALPEAHAHPQLPPPKPGLPSPPALPKAFANCFLEILRRLWCSFPLTQETTQQFCFSKSGTHKPGILSSIFPLEFSLAGCLSPGPRPGGHTQSALCWALSSQPSGHFQRGYLSSYNCFPDGDTESGGSTGGGAGGGAVDSLQARARLCYYQVLCDFLFFGKL